MAANSSTRPTATGQIQPVSSTRRAQVHQGQHMPVQFGHVGHRHQLAAAVHRDPGRLHRLRIGLRRVHGRAQFLAPAGVQQGEHHATAIGAAGAGVVAISVGSMCAWIAPVSSTMMGVTPAWPLLTKSRRKPPTSRPAPVRPAPCRRRAPGVDPDPRGLELQVGVDVDVVERGRLQRLVEPAVIGGAAAQRVARRLGQDWSSLK